MVHCNKQVSQSGMNGCSTAW